LILESFHNPRWVELCEPAGIAPEKLGALRDVFLSAGAAAIAGRAGLQVWRQINIYFDALGLRWYCFASGDFLERLSAWHACGVVRQFCFVHKPPGLRLRFLGAQEPMVAELHRAMDELQAAGQIDNWSCGLYDSEPYQFGGDAGADVAHRFFTIESVATLAYHRVRLRGQASLEPVMFSLLLIELLLREATGDEWERWDIWQKMELTGRLERMDKATEARALHESVRARRELAQFLFHSRELSSPEREIIAQYRETLPDIAQEIRQLHDTGRLLWPTREIIPFWIIFHWNRMAFSLEEQRRITFLMTELYSPHQR